MNSVEAGLLFARVFSLAVQWTPRSLFMYNQDTVATLIAAAARAGVGTPAPFEMPKAKPGAAVAPASGQYDLFLSHASETRRLSPPFVYRPRGRRCVCVVDEAVLSWVTPAAEDR